MSSTTMSTVVVADPDERSRRVVAAALRYGGYGVAIAHHDKQIISFLGRRPVAAVVIDPVGAEQAVSDLRARTDVPIIVVSDRSAERDKVAVLDAGADDYLCKPVGVEELLARLRGFIRRTVPRADEEDPVVTADFTVDLGDRRLLLADGHDVHLTPIEWRLIDALTRRRGHLVSQAHLLERVWGPSATSKPEYLRVHMASIRRKLEPDPSHPRYFVTVTGLGLRFEPTGCGAR
jgi:two-component system, OmpR family, KDP operon response regulator KdpE